MQNKKSITARIEKTKEFYSRANRRPLLAFTVGSEYPLHSHNAAANLPETRPLKPDDFTVESYLDDFERLWKTHEAAGGDTVWTASAFWGIPWLEALLGCTLHARAASGSIHSEAPLSFNGKQTLPAFDPANPWAVKAREFLQKTTTHSAGRYALGTTRMRGIADLLAALYGNDNFIFAMIEEPETAERLCRELTDFWISFARFQLDLLPDFYGGIGSFYYNIWAPAGTVWLQEDAAALLSPELYNRFIRPCDERIISEFPCIQHIHPTGYYPWKEYSGMNFTALELHIDRGGKSAEELYPVHCSIMKNKPLIIWGELSDQDIDWIFSKLAPAGLAVIASVADVSSAQKICARLGYLR